MTDPKLLLGYNLKQQNKVIFKPVSNLERLLSHQLTLEVPEQKLEKQQSGIHPKLKNVIRLSISKVDRFQVGNINFRLENWKKVTSDKYILDIIKYWLKLDSLMRWHILNLSK